MATTPTTLQEQLDNLRANAMRGAPDLFATLDDNIAQLVRTDAVAHVLKPGSRAADFILPSAGGGNAHLADLLGHGPVVVTFFRGEWCPFCDLTLRAFETSLRTLASHRATLVAISPQTIEHTLSTAATKQLHYPVLSDVGNVVAREYGLVYSLTDGVRRAYAVGGLDLPAFNGDDSFELPMPATFLVGRDGLIKWAFVDPDFTRRPDPRDLLAQVAELDWGAE